MRLLICLTLLSILNLACDMSENSALNNYCSKQALSTKIGYNNPQTVTQTNFLQSIKPLLDQHCMQCHEAGQQRPDLSKWEDLKSNKFTLAKLAVERVLNGDMPKVRPLDENAKEIFRKWQQGGFLYEGKSSEAMDCGKLDQPQPAIPENIPDEAERKKEG